MRSVRLQVHFYANRTYFHMEGFARVEAQGKLGNGLLEC